MVDGQKKADVPAVAEPEQRGFVKPQPPYKPPYKTIGSANRSARREALFPEKSPEIWHR